MRNDDYNADEAILALSLFFLTLIAYGAMLLMSW